MTTKQLRKIVNRARRDIKTDVPLSHILINIKTWNSAWPTMQRLKPLLLDRSLSREYGIRSRVIGMYGTYYCYNPSFSQSHYGRKTYFVDGEYLTSDPNELPF